MKHLKKKALALLSQNPGKPYTIKDLSKHLKVKASDEYHKLRALVQSLVEDGVLVEDERGRVQYIPGAGKSKKQKPSNRIVGVLSVTKRGSGFVRVRESDEEFFIPPKLMHTAMHGDTVAVVPFARPVGRRGRSTTDKVEGEIVEVIERTTTQVIGRLEESRNFFFVVPDDPRIPRDIYVSKEDGIQARNGDKVLVHLLPWENKQLNPEGMILEVLGRAGDPQVEVMSVALSFALPTKFPEPVLREVTAMRQTISESEIKQRHDLRTIVTFTIDPEDAKDFDDAISFEQMDNGNVRLGVHIADVSHYVREGSALDGEALLRGTSVYLVNEVIPMLPERLSNDLCSLRPNEDRLTFSVIMELTSQGKVVDYQITKSIIHSARRFSYEEVQAIIDRGKGELAATLLPLHKLTQTLTKKRKKNGSIDFETPEAKFKFDAEGMPSQIIAKTRLDAHRLVEECMLLANKTVAKHIGQEKSDEAMKPFIYRVHDSPDPERLQDLANFVKQFGYSLDAKKGVSSLALQKLLDKVKGSEVENLINEVTLRSMAKAVYSEKNIGHYGLAFKYYTHFTSPIRRYPDLIVHRLLEEYARGITNKRREEMSKRVPAISKQSSERERIAVEAERTSVKVMQVEYMKRHIGDEFNGVIGGVTNFGLFVEINDLLVEGLVKIRDLMDDYYLYDEKHYSLRGRTRGKTYRLGDSVRVRVANVDPEEREIDLAIVGG